MTKAIDISSKRFGRLLALNCIGSKRGAKLWEFLCDCGAVVQKTAVSVIHGKVTSCGCYRSELTSLRKSNNFTGQRFGRFLVIQRAGVNKHGHIEWACKCDCGNDFLTSSTSIRKGTKSCGCLQREVASATQKAKALPSEVKKQNVKNSRSKQKEKIKSNPLLLMHSRLSRLHRHALTRLGLEKSSPTLELLGYSAADFCFHIEKQFVDGMGWHNMSDWQIDHIIPISTAKSIEDVIALNQLSNLRPMWAKDNNQKKAKIMVLL